MKKLFYLLMALPLLVVACDKGDETTEEPKRDTLELISDEVMEFEAAGGRGTISYRFTSANPISDNQVVAPAPTLSVACDADWVEVMSDVYLPSGQINFSVAQNQTTEPRATKIVATYNDLSFEVSVKQAAATETPEPEPTLEGWGIIGTMNEWSMAKAIVLESVEGYYVAKAVELTTTDKFKFIKDGDNALNRGGNGQAAEPNYFYTAQSWGSDIHVSQAGTYDIYLNAKEDTYYIMSEGKSPAEALEPLAPGEDLYEVYGNFEGDNTRLVAEKSYMVAKGLKFLGATAEFDIRLNENETIFGAKADATYAVEEQINVAEGGATIKVAVESGAQYDIYYRTDLSSVWLMPEGIKPLIWEEVTGVAFSSTNFAINLRGEGIELFFDFNCGVPAQNNIIPEGTYYVNNDEDGGFNFNLENEYDIRIDGFKTKLKDGQMVIKHISGGYDIYVDVESIHNHKVQVRYTGPIGEIDIMGRPITNPE